MSFLIDKVVSEGLTFNDILLIPYHSDVLHRESELSSQVTRNIRIHTLVVTAAMDTVIIPEWQSSVGHAKTIAANGFKSKT